MRYLKTYNEAISNIKYHKLERDISDIFSELKEIGLVDYWLSFPKNLVIIDITRSLNLLHKIKSVEWSIVKDTVDRLISHMESGKYELVDIDITLGKGLGADGMKHLSLDSSSKLETVPIDSKFTSISISFLELNDETLKLMGREEKEEYNESQKHKYFDENVEMDIRDILLELSDDGFWVRVDPEGNFFNDHLPIINITKQLKSGSYVYPHFYWVEVKDSILRLFDYFKINNIPVKDWIIHKHGGYSGEKNLNLNELNDDFSMVGILINPAPRGINILEES